jgi:golgi SNAP receptor complex member 2
MLCLKGPVSQRQNYRMRVDQLKYDSRHLSAALNSWYNRVMRQQREEAEREALLARKFTTNDHVDIFIDHTVQHNNSLHNAVHGVDDMLHQGHNVLDNLRSQRLTLKGAHKRLIDIGNTLGLSNTTMRLIEQRTKQDGFILVFGMTLTCIIILLVIVYLT